MHFTQRRIPVRFGLVGKGFHVRSGLDCWRGRRLIDKTLTEPPGASARSEPIRTLSTPASHPRQQTSRNTRNKSPSGAFLPQITNRRRVACLYTGTHDKIPSQPPTQVTRGARGSIRRQQHRKAARGAKQWMGGVGGHNKFDAHHHPPLRPLSPPLIRVLVGGVSVPAGRGLW